MNLSVFPLLFRRAGLRVVIPGAVFLALAALPGCLAVSVAGDVAEGAVRATGDVAEGAVRTTGAAAGAVLPGDEESEEASSGD